MPLTNLHRKQLIIFYFICFAGTYCWLVNNHLLLQQIKPVFFLNKLDFSRNLLMLSGIQHFVLNSHLLQILLDVVYILSPLALLISSLTGHKSQYGIAIFNSIINFVYAMMLTSISTLSIEGFISWILIPVIFSFRSSVSFFYLLQSMRYFFLLIFVSAAIWKIRAGGIFNVEQMSAILVKQHAGYLLAEPFNRYSQFVSFFINHPKLSWILYLVATMAELFFLIGFFTKKYDTVLIVVFIIFLFFDFLVMQINYISWFVFMGTIWFAKYSLPETGSNHFSKNKFISASFT